MEVTPWLKIPPSLCGHDSNNYLIWHLRFVDWDVYRVYLYLSILGVKTFKDSFFVSIHGKFPLNRLFFLLTLACGGCYYNRFLYKMHGPFFYINRKKNHFINNKKQGMSVYMVDNISEFLIVGRFQGTHRFSKTKKTKLVLEFKVNKIF